MKDFSTDLSELLGLTPLEMENAVPAGTGNGVETSAAQKITYQQLTENALENQAWAAVDAGPQWCAWREESRKEKLTKIPYSSPRDMARPNDPATWWTHARANAVAADLLSGGCKGGVGPFLGGEGGMRFGGIDLASCLGLLGDLEPWAAEVLARFSSYAEVSPSGTGVKVFSATMPPIWNLCARSWARSGAATSRAANIPGSESFSGTSISPLPGSASTPRPRQLRRHDRLVDAQSSGILQVMDSNGESIRYRSHSELAAALASLEAEI